MKKVVLASLLAVAGFGPSSFALQPLVLGHAAQQPAQAAAGQVQMSAEEYAVYNNANTQTTPAGKAAAFEAYLKTYPQSAVKADVLQQIMFNYSQTGDVAKTLDAADRLLAVDPNNYRAFVFEVSLRKDSDPNAAADYAKKGLAASKPASLSDADWTTLQTAGKPIFYSAIGTAALNNKDSAGAVSAFTSELTSVPAAQTTAPGLQLQDTYSLARAYMIANPPDLLKCGYYAARGAYYAPEPYKTTFKQLATYCYKKFHGKDEGFDAMQAVAKDNLTIPASLSIAPAPTAADIVTNLIATTPDLASLATSDKEYVLQNGKPEDAEKVFGTIKGKTVEIPGAVVLEATESQIKAAVSEDAVQSKTADFTFNFATPMKSVPAKDTKINITGTYTSYTQSPMMIVMDNAALVQKAAPAKKAAPAHRPAARRR